MIKTLHLHNFRSYIDSTFEFGPGINVITGPNGSGKTNILEAVALLVGQKPIRGTDDNFIRHSELLMRLEGVFDLDLRVVKVSSGGPKEYSINEKVYKRLSNERRLPIVLFEPSHLTLVTGRPELRRAYLDDLLSQLSAGYDRTMNQYKRTLAQRNALLKFHQSDKIKDQLFVWDVRLSDLGARIAKQRSGLADAIDLELSNVYSQIAGRTTAVSVVYMPEFEINSYSTLMLKALQSNTDTDIQRGYTSTGPHREDLEVTLNRHSAAANASRGETRSLVLALKMVSLKLLDDKLQKPPVLLLDDVFGELDSTRRKALVGFVGAYQTIITATDRHGISGDYPVIELVGI